ncbi:hypothetical protein [Klebsiella pneumoniae IS39]|nr:hypothetical protein [Klebsiella pneumoniae IS39]
MSVQSSVRRFRFYSGQSLSGLSKGRALELHQFRFFVCQRRVNFF